MHRVFVIPFGIQLSVALLGHMRHCKIVFENICMILF